MCTRIQAIVLLRINEITPQVSAVTQVTKNIWHDEHYQTYEIKRYVTNYSNWKEIQGIGQNIGRRKGKRTVQVQK